MPRETRRRNFGGLKGSGGARVFPSCGGPPKHSRPVASCGASGGVHRAPNSWFWAQGWVLRVLVLSCLDPKTWASRTPGITGWLGSSQLSVTLHSGAGTCGCVWGRYPQGPLFPVPRCTVRPLTFTAMRAPHRLRGGHGWPLGGGRSGSPGLKSAAPPPPPVSAGSSLPACAESQSSKAQPERSKKELLFPTLERAALRSLRETWDPSLAAGDLGLRRVGKVGGGREAPPSFPLPHPAFFSFNRPSLPSAPSSPPTCSSLRDQFSPPLRSGRGGGSRINPPPTRLFPFPPPPPGSPRLDFAPGR